MINPIVPIVVILGIGWVVYYQLRSRDLSLFNRGRKFHESKLVGVLLGLDGDAIRELLELYKKEFGNGPARYARKTPAYSILPR